MSLFRLILRGLLINLAGWAALMLVLLGLYSGWLREWQMTWGATDEEVARSMAGDELLDDPHFNATRAVEIDAPPEQVWPWIVQMGYKRAGFYSFDNLDNDGLPSAERILPQFQDLKVGDSIPLGEPGPTVRVEVMEPPATMLWVFSEDAGNWANSTWSWSLQPTAEGRTRLVTRLRVNYTLDSLRKALMWGLLDSTEIMMMRSCLLGIKRRVEDAMTPVRQP